MHLILEHQQLSNGSTFTLISDLYCHSKLISFKQKAVSDGKRPESHTERRSSVGILNGNLLLSMQITSTLAIEAKSAVLLISHSMS